MNFAPLQAEMPPHACETASGRYVDVVNPNPHDISIYDIAWSLSRQARYAGHTLGEPYSVAQHACFVEELVDMVFSHDMFGHDMFGHPLQQSLNLWLADGGYVNRAPHGFHHAARRDLPEDVMRMHALCHDNTEAYLVDLPSPVKRHSDLREPYKKLEAGMHKCICKALGLPILDGGAGHSVVVWADTMALMIEAANIMPSRGRGWSGNFPMFQLDFIGLMPKILPWKQAHDKYLERYHELAHKLRIRDFKYFKYMDIEIVNELPVV